VKASHEVSGHAGSCACLERPDESGALFKQKACIVKARPVNVLHRHECKNREQHHDGAYKNPGRNSCPEFAVNDFFKHMLII
jgi:hypothetical protein